MCYAISDQIEHQTVTEVSEVYNIDQEGEQQHVSSGKKNVYSNMTSLKRAASTAIDDQQDKAAKRTKLDDRANDTENTKRSKEKDDSSSVSLTGSESTEAQDDEAKTELKEVEEDRNKYRLEALDLRKENEKLKSELNTAKVSVKGKGSDLSKVLEKEISERWKGKLQREKHKHEKKSQDLKDQYDGKVKAKHDLYQKKIDELRVKHEDQLNAKDAAHQKKGDDFTKKVDELKVKHTDLEESKDRAHQKKIDELKAKHAGQQNAKDEAHQNKVDEFTKYNQDLRDKIKSLDKELKDAKAEHSKAEKELKAEHQEAQKKSKAEQQEEIKKWKPDHSDAVKAKDAELKESRKAKKDLQSELEKSRKDFDKLMDLSTKSEDQRKKVEADFKKREDEIWTKANLLQTRDKDLEISRGETEKQHEEFEAILAEQGRKWQKQATMAENAVREREQTQKTNFVLRNAMNSKDKEIERLKVELSVAKEQAVIVQTIETEVSMSSGPTVDITRTAKEGLEAKDLGDGSASDKTLGMSTVGSGAVLKGQGEQVQVMGDGSMGSMT